MVDVISESRFYMWRTLFAMVHADDVVTDEEVRFMAEALEDIPFSLKQQAILEVDMRDAQDITEMFSHVSEVKDQAAFFALAREVVHVDGDYGIEEQEIMLKLQKAHVKRADLDDLIGGIELSFADEEPSVSEAETLPVAGKKKTIGKFRQFFLKGLRD